MASRRQRRRCHATNKDGEACDCEDYEERKIVGKCVCQDAKSMHWVDEPSNKKELSEFEDDEDGDHNEERLIDNYYDDMIKKAGGESALRRKSSTASAVTEANRGFRPASPKKPAPSPVRSPALQLHVNLLCI